MSIFLGILSKRRLGTCRLKVEIDWEKQKVKILNIAKRGFIAEVEEHGKLKKVAIGRGDSLTLVGH